MLIALPVAYVSSISDVSPSHWRIQAAILKTDKMDILIINSYFPTDNGILQVFNEELEEIFYAIEDIIKSNAFSALILVGDLNADFM